MTHIEIAREIYSVIRAINLNFGRTDYPEWDSAPEENRDTFIAGVLFHLEHPELNAEQTHDWWLKDKAGKGWSWGPVKDSMKLEHPSMVPFHLLSELEQAKDIIFSTLVHILKHR